CCAARRRFHERASRREGDFQRSCDISVEAGSRGGSGVKRIDGDAARSQATRELFGKKAVCQFGLSVKLARLVEPMAVQIIEHDAFGRSLVNAGAAAYDHDAAGPVAHPVEEF